MSKIRTKYLNQFNLEFSDHKGYLDTMKSQFESLLKSLENGNTKNEAAVQRFIENAPIAITGILSNLHASYNIAGGVLISQPRIKDYSGDRQPDFLLVTCNSLNVYFNFIEIECPTKLFLQKNRRKISKNYFEAVAQVREWESSFTSKLEEYSNNLVEKLFVDCPDFNNKKNINHSYTLVYGSSNEIDIRNDAELNKQVQSYVTGINLVTYSRLVKEMGFRGPLISIKRKSGLNQFIALGMVPWKNYGIDEWQNYHLVLEKEQVVRNCSFLSEDERNILINKMNKLDKMTKEEIWRDDNLTTTNISEITDL